MPPSSPSPTSSPVTIRRATRADLPALGRLGAYLVRLHHSFDPDRFLAPQPNVESGYAWFLGTQLEDPEVIILAAEKEGRVVGYAYAGIEPMSWKELRGPAGFVHDVVVAENARRVGVGTMLMHAAIDWLRDHGAPRVLLGTAAPNEAAQALFHRLGFRNTMIEMTMELS